MASSFGPVFTATQAALRDDPGAAVALATVATRQAQGLRSEAVARGFRLTVDQPAAHGGQDAGPTPAELVLAALGASHEATYRYYADTLGIALDAVAVKVEGRSDLRGFFGVEDGVRPGFREVRLTATLVSRASTDDLQRLKAIVDRHCPVLDMLRNVTPVRTEYITATAAQTAA